MSRWNAGTMSISLGPVRVRMIHRICPSPALSITHAVAPIIAVSTTLPVSATGNVPDEEMQRAFNMGVAIVVAIAQDEADAVIEQLDGAWRIGTVGDRGSDEPAVRGLE